ncbi:MAG: pantoate kinase [Methanobacteriota archaeon]
MIRQVTAFCPGHISGFFLPIITGDPATSGSCGGGIVIDSGVTVTVSSSPTSSVNIYQIRQTGLRVKISDHSPTLHHLLQMLNVSATVETNCHLPLSAGYGLSAASLLATVHAVNILFNLELSPVACSDLAHSIEVIERTGLGDVSACQGGGWVYRGSPGPQGKIIRHDDDRPVYALTLGPLRTASVLSSPEYLSRIKQAFPGEEPTYLEDLFRYSRRFAEGFGFISDEVRKVLIACDTNDIPASMTMLGNGVFALGNRSQAVLTQFGSVYPLHIAKEGPQILEVLS